MALQSECDIQNYREFQEFRREGRFSVEDAPLGALLTLLNYYYINDETDVAEYFAELSEGLSGEDLKRLSKYTGGLITAENILKKDLQARGIHTEEGEYEQCPLFPLLPHKKSVLALPYGFLLSDPALLIQGINEEGLERFIAEWYAAQSGEKCWNPVYAPSVELRPEVVDFCKTHSVHDILYEFTLYRKRDSSYGSPLLTETFLDVLIKDNDLKEIILYPMTGWSLAECIRLSYEHFEKQK